MGKIMDDNGTAMPAANVMIKGTNLGAATNINGVYRIRQVPSGTYTLQVTYIGYETATKKIQVQAGRTVDADLVLKTSAVKIADVYVTAIAGGQSRSIMERRESAISKQVVSSQEMERFGDTNLAGSLGRLPGINIEYDMGEASKLTIRGQPMDRNLVQYNGVPMASTDATGRSTNISSMSSGMIESVEVIKVPTPDMPSEAIGGIINIKSSSPSPGKRNMELKLSGDYISRAKDFGPDVLFRFSQGFRHGIGISAQGEYRQVKGYGEDYNAQWAGTEVGVLPTVVNSQMHWRNSTRYGGSVRLNYNPNKTSNFFLSGVFNYQDNLDERQKLSIMPADGLEREITEGVFEVKSSFELGDKRGGNVDLTGVQEMRGIRQLTLAGGGEHTLPLFDLQYQASYSQGVARMDYNREINWEANWDNSFIIDTRGDIPKFSFRPYNYGSTKPDSIASIIDPKYYIFDGLVINQENAVHEKLRGKVDVIVPYQFANNASIKVKFGTAVDHDIKSRRKAELDFDRNTTGLSKNPEHVGETIEDPRFEGVWMRPFVERTTMPLPQGNSVPALRFNFDRFMDWFNGNLDLSNEMDFDRPKKIPFDVQNYNESITNDYDLTEGTIAGYLMATLALGKTELISGVRTEWMYGNYRGVLTETQTYQRPDGHTGERRVILGPLDESFSDVAYFPSFHVKHEFTDYTIFRGSVTYGMKRANYTDLMPAVHYDYADRTITQGNPELKPERSTQIDFSIEQFFGNVGSISANAFFNNFTQFIHTREYIIREGQFRGWERRLPINGEHAQNYGIELSWVQPLDYLPGILGNLGVYANYTYLVSRARVSEPFARFVQQPGLAPMRFNYGLSFDKGGFSMLVSGSYVAEYLESIDSEIISLVHMDRYAKSEWTLDATMRQRILKNLRLTLDLRNITSTARDYYILKPVDEDAYLVESLRRSNKELPNFLESWHMFGFSANIGLRFEF